MKANLDFQGDIINGVIKSIVFGFVVSWIALFEGYDAIPTAEGVSRATTRTVVNIGI
jgi:phospholipid/cholesterol/gamma-HCH transport system permease protein